MIFKRLIGLDILKGLAVLLMIIYHFFFDLHYFQYLQIDFLDTFWQAFRYLIVSLFLFSVGVSLVLAHREKIHLHKVIKRFVLLGIAAFSVSIISYFLFPNSWIYFGILHFIWAASLLALAVLFHPKIALILAVFIWLATFLGLSDSLWFSALQPQILPYSSQDFVPIFPWLATVFLGISIARFGWHQQLFSLLIWSKLPAHKGLAYLGKYALWVYLIHQPILFAGFYIFAYL
ncbi:MAG: DUF1624 domain-containing protein [Betaproteobacteria bacterium]|nr:DUF1624 domain-containing protein [Betaproteobacteria bacterium]MBE8190282.1 DUF1624 domain-containing protein [Candidatus Thioglobus sp.]